MVKAKRKRQPRVHSDFGTEERRQHGPIVIERIQHEEDESTTNRDRARAIEMDDPLYVYRRNKTINAAQKCAGIILRELWARTGLEPRVTSRYEEWISAGSIASLRVKSADQYQHFVKAIRAVGPECSNEVIAACCLQERVRNVASLRTGLDRLEEHFNRVRRAQTY